MSFFRPDKEIFFGLNMRPTYTIYKNKIISG